MGKGWLIPTEDSATGAADIGLSEMSPEEVKLLAPVSMQDELTAKMLVGLEALLDDPSTRGALASELGPTKAQWQAGSIDQRCGLAIFEAFSGQPAPALAAVQSAQEVAATVGEQWRGAALARVEATRQAVEGQPMNPEQWQAIESLGYFHGLAQGMQPGGNAETLRSSAVQSIMTLIAFGVIVLLSGMAGLVLLIVVGVNSAARGVPAAAGTERARWCAAEVFAIYLVTAGGLNLVALWTFRSKGAEETDIGTVEVNESMGWLGLVFQMGLMMIPFVALAWPLKKGIPWSEMRTALGLNAGRSIIREVASGLAIYCMMLPLVLCGFIVFMVLATAYEALAGAGAPPPSHPIIEEIRAGGLSMVLVLVLAAIAAPIVEEIFFRGALFDSFRARWSPMGRWGGLIAAAMVSSFIFAAIHPQGVLFAPVLMGTALALCIGRVWRGSLIGPMVAHGINNGLVVALNFAIWS